MAQINVGAATETEMKERKALLEDARAATHAALEEGIVPGGGVALLRSEKALDKLEARRRRKAGRRDRPQRARLPAPRHRRKRRRRRRSGRQPRAADEGQEPKATTPTRTNTATWSRPASSTPRRWFAPPAKRGQRGGSAADHRSRSSAMAPRMKTNPPAAATTMTTAVWVAWAAWVAWEWAAWAA